MTATDLNAYCSERGVLVHPSLAELYASDLPRRLAGLLCLPSEDEDDSVTPTMAWAEATVDGSAWPLPYDLVPLQALDARSFACVVLSRVGEPPDPQAGTVVRWHIGLSRDRQMHQRAQLDTDCYLYAESLVAELEARQAGIDRVVGEVSPAYEVNYLDIEKRPRDFVLRPLRLACQNVIVGLAAFQHDSTIDGTAVLAWQTCELPHVATHEGNRALAALMLCDAFQSGGTMEIRFDRPTRLRAKGSTKRSGKPVDIDVAYSSHPENCVPASLRRYGRTVGVALGVDDPQAISPREARELFKRVTPMPDDLRHRVETAVSSGTATPERLCFTLLAQVWSRVELDFMLGVSIRTASIIRGGADWRHRAERQAEAEITRAAYMVGMLFARLDNVDKATGASPSTLIDQAATDGLPPRDDVRLIEGERVGVTWRVIEEIGAVVFDGVRAGELPWQRGVTFRAINRGEQLLVIPRSIIDSDDVALAADMAADYAHVALLAPQASQVPTGMKGNVLVLQCPDRLPEIDRVVERKLQLARTTRA